MSPRFSSSGLDTFDLLGDLSSSERTLTRIFLRNTTMTEKALLKAISELPEKKQVSKKEMKGALKTLIKKGWIEKKRSGFRNVYIIKQKKRLM